MVAVAVNAQRRVVLTEGCVGEDAMRADVKGVTVRLPGVTCMFRASASPRPRLVALRFSQRPLYYYS